MRSSSAVVAPKLATSRALLSRVAAHTQCCSLPKSIPATLARMTGKPSIGLVLLSDVSLSSLPGIVTYLSEHARPGWLLLILLQGRATKASPMFNAFLEPCCPCGIGTNENRVVAAVVLS